MLFNLYHKHEFSGIKLYKKCNMQDKIFRINDKFSIKYDQLLFYMRFFIV